ncbi:MAG: ABC transporter ATP-binding protein [Crocinitomicaceae bacterium]
MENPIIEVEGVIKYYGNSKEPSLNGINLSIYAGEKFGIFGPNGAGKTTLISILCDILQPTEGSVKYTVENQPLSVADILPQIGFVPQDFAFYAELTAKQNLHFFGGVYGLEKEVCKERTDSLLKTLGLDHVANKRVKTFSGGMKRRINLAIGLIHEPKIVFLDEPTVGVDVQSKMSIIQLLEDLNAKGTTLIYTSHHLREAEDFCSRVALMDHGKIIAVNTVPELLVEHKVANMEELMINLTGKQLRD